LATQADVRRIAFSLPETEEAPNHFAFSVRIKGKPKGFVWVWMERVTPKKARVPQPKVIAVRVASLEDKGLLTRAGSGEVLYRAALQRVSRRSGAVTRRDGPRAQADHHGGVA
jgi:hypothetical protein